MVDLEDRISNRFEEMATLLKELISKEGYGHGSSSKRKAWLKEQPRQVREHRHRHREQGEEEEGEEEDSDNCQIRPQPERTAYEQYHYDEVEDDHSLIAKASLDGEGNVGQYVEMKERDRERVGPSSSGYQYPLTRASSITGAFSSKCTSSSRPKLRPARSMTETTARESPKEYSELTGTFDYEELKSLQISTDDERDSRDIGTSLTVMSSSLSRTRSLQIDVQHEQQHEGHALRQTHSDSRDIWMDPDPDPDMDDGSPLNSTDDPKQESSHSSSRV